MLTKEQMLERAKKDLSPEEVEIKQWDDSAFVRGMTGAERESLLTKVADESGRIDRATYRTELVTRTLCDADGVRLFGDDESALVGSFPGPVLQALADVAQRLSGLGGEAEAEKN